MTDLLRSRARGCLAGLAIGDALGGPTEGKSREAIARQWGRLTGFLTEMQAGSDDTEHALFNSRLLLKHGPRLDAGLIADGWRSEIVKSGSAHKGAGFSEMLAIRNLKAGLQPPQSGYHAHSWSDGLAMRVAPFGIVAAGLPEVAARLAMLDGSVTNAGEGIYAGQSVAAAVATAMGGGDLDEIIEAGLSVAPPDSWTRRAIDRAVAIGSRCDDVWASLAPLYDGLVCAAYFWSDIAPEAVGLAFGILASSRGEFSDAVLGGVNVGRDTDTIAAIAGAIAGARHGINAIPPEWSDRINSARGTCLSVVAGMNIQETADQLAALSGRWRE